MHLVNFCQDHVAMHTSFAEYLEATQDLQQNMKPLKFRSRDEAQSTIVSPIQHE